MNPYEIELAERELEESLIKGYRKGILVLFGLLTLIVLYFAGLAYVADSLTDEVYKHFKVEPSHDAF